jgi:predicted dehydrogenase
MAMGEQLKIVLVGIGGYGNTYVSALLNQSGERTWQLQGVVDPLACKATGYAALQALGLPFYDSMDEFYAENSADLALISSPIQYHCAQTCAALQHGSNVLCEKPVSAVIQEVERMIAARDAAKRFVAIGYQWSFHTAIQAFKADVLAGLFGRPKRLRTMVLWPRNDKYYGRNNWAGALQSSQGDWILDSPVNNACAHYLHNMLYVIGPAVDRSATPISVQAELYRANPISNYDTAAMRVMTSCGVEILFYTTHAVTRSRGPEFLYEFEKATVSYGLSSKTLQADFHDGGSKNYGSLDGQVPNKLWDAIAACRGEKSIACGLEAAKMHTLCVNGAQDSVPAIKDFPSSWVYKAGVPGNQFRVMPGLADLMPAAYDAGVLLSEQQPQTWSQLGRVVSLRDYRSFPSQ